MLQWYSDITWACWKWLEVQEEMDPWCKKKWRPEERIYKTVPSSPISSPVIPSFFPITLFCFFTKKIKPIWYHASHPNPPSLLPTWWATASHDTEGCPLSLHPPSAMSAYGCLGTISSSTLGLSSRWFPLPEPPSPDRAHGSCGQVALLSISGWGMTSSGKAFWSLLLGWCRYPSLGLQPPWAQSALPACVHICSQSQPHEDTHLYIHQGVQGLVPHRHLAEVY